MRVPLTSPTKESVQRTAVQSTHVTTWPIPAWSHRPLITVSVSCIASLTTAICPRSHARQRSPHLCRTSKCTYTHRTAGAVHRDVTAVVATDVVTSEGWSCSHHGPHRRHDLLTENSLFDVEQVRVRDFVLVFAANLITHKVCGSGTQSPSQFSRRCSSSSQRA